jgi:hypothetical protein
MPALYQKVFLLSVLMVMIQMNVAAQDLRNQDCAIASQIWSAMRGTPAIAKNNACCSSPGISCSTTRITIM